MQRFLCKVMLAVAAAAAMPFPAAAEWLEASSRHFVIYSDTREAELRELATRLESFDAALRYLNKLPEPTEKPANRLTIYVLSNQTAVARLLDNNSIAGVYLPRAAGSVAFTPRQGQGVGRGAMTPQIVLFHEYAHHMLLGNMVIAYPKWFSEGYAEFVSTASFDKNVLMIGEPALHRAYGLFESNLPLPVLFAPEGKRMTGLQFDQLYGRGWLLTHYLMSDVDRTVQLNKYLAALNAGTPSVAAAEAAFGRLDKLDLALRGYMRARQLKALGVDVTKLAVSPVAVRRLSAGEEALIDERMVSERGVDAKEAKALLGRARKGAAPFHADAVAQGWLAEMAYDAGALDEAEAAADRALAADPRASQALLYKARIRMARAVAAKSTDAAVWKDVRSFVIRANRANPDDADPLLLFYQTFGAAGETPSKSAVQGLLKAHELVPQDADLRFMVVHQHLRDDHVAEARRALRPLAYQPHVNNAPAQRLLALLDGKISGPAALQAMEAEAKAAAKTASKD